jgi:hypothetical protein
LTGGLRDTIAQLTRGLDERGRRRFHQLRKRPDTVFEIAITGIEMDGEDTFRDRVTAALELMAAEGYQRFRVVIAHAK